MRIMPASAEAAMVSRAAFSSRPAFITALEKSPRTQQGDRSKSSHGTWKLSRV